MTPAFAQARLDSVRPFIVLDVMEKANRLESTGRDVLHLEVGQPGTPAPSRVLAAAHQALETERLGYTEALGVHELRARIARHYRDAYGLEIAPDRVAVTTGSSGGFILAFLAAFEPGARVALAEPGYPAYRNILAALGLEAVGVPTTAEDRFQITPALLDRLGPDLDGVIVASPANPTGTMLPAEALGALAAYCSDRGIRLISDEIYHGITYSMDSTSALEFTDDAVVLNSFSKYYSMTGWRIGWMILPENLCRPIERLAQNLFISVPTLSQRAALAAFDCRDELDANVARYAANRELLLSELPALGFDILAPADGAFYLYADVSRLTNHSGTFGDTLLQETGVAIATGLDFDAARGHTTVRISFAGTTETMAEAVRRIREWSGR